jgi:hypothetical protein
MWERSRSAYSLALAAVAGYEKRNFLVRVNIYLHVENFLRIYQAHRDQYLKPIETNDYL